MTIETSQFLKNLKYKKFKFSNLFLKLIETSVLLRSFFEMV